MCGLPLRDLHEQGINLPVVMDDALVNFDDQRAVPHRVLLLNSCRTETGIANAGSRVMHTLPSLSESEGNCRTLGTGHPPVADATDSDDSQQRSWRAEEYFLVKLSSQWHQT